MTWDENGMSFHTSPSTCLLCNDHHHLTTPSIATTPSNMSPFIFSVTFVGSLQQTSRAEEPHMLVVLSGLTSVLSAPRSLNSPVLPQVRAQLLLTSASLLSLQVATVLLTAIPDLYRYQLSSHVVPTARKGAEDRQHFTPFQFRAKYYSENHTQQRGNKAGPQYATNG